MNTPIDMRSEVPDPRVAIPRTCANSNNLHKTVISFNPSIFDRITERYFSDCLLWRLSSRCCHSKRRCNLGQGLPFITRKAVTVRDDQEHNYYGHVGTAHLFQASQ